MIKEIFLTAEILENKPENGPVDYEDLSTDVVVSLDNGDKYIATFFSYKCLEKMLEVDSKSGEFFSKQYYKILEMVLVKDFGNLIPIIENMIAEGDFQLVFRKM